MNNSTTPIEGQEQEWKPSAEELDTFEENACEVFEAFLDSMKNDPKYVRPYDPDDDPFEAEGSQWMWSDRAMRLIDRMLTRLNKLAQNKFGAWAIDITIESYLYVEF